MPLPIHPEGHQLSALVSQQGLAEKAAQIKGASVSKRTIARIESGEIAPEKVRPHTVESLAKVLGVAPETLGKPASETDGATLEEAGFRRVSVWLSKEVRQNYRWTTHHYDVSVKDLIDAAPWMFTLLAEMSLAERTKRLKMFEEAFKGAMALIPEHLAHGGAAYTDYERAVGDENDSLASRDLFGKILLASKHTALDPFDPDESNPFFDFLRRTAETLDSDAIDPELMGFSRSGLPRWPVFEHWFHQMTGGDRWARFAAENVKGLVDEILTRDDLKGEEKTPERVRWLIDRIPADMKAQEEERLAKWEAEIARIEL